MSKVWWQVVVVMVCAASGILASDVPGDLAVEPGSPEAAQGASGPPAESPLSTADRLQKLSRVERSNARLSVEGVDALGEIERQQARQVEALWAAGRHDEAIGLLSRLEAGGARLAAGISWRRPVASAPKSRGADARIGAPTVGAEDVALDFDQETGNLFAVVAWQDDSSTLNLSTDGGATWSQLSWWWPSTVVDAAVVEDYLYVAYSRAAISGRANINRFFASDGSSDPGYGNQAVADVSPNTILDIAAGANADYEDNRIFVAFIESNNRVRFFWDVASDGTTWTEMSPSPAMVSAAWDLDIHWGGGTIGGDPNRLWLSCLGTDDNVHVLAVAASGSWNHYSFSPALYTNTRTRISAQGDYVVVAYTAEGTNAHAPGYHASYNNGTSWFYGYAYDPPAGAPGCVGVDVTARGGWGTGIVYNSESSFDPVSVVTREDYAQGSPWNPPQTFNEFDAISGAPSFIQYLRPLGAFGMVYLAGDTTSTAIPYFDVIALMPFDDGFDFGDTSAWSDVVP